MSEKWYPHRGPHVPINLSMEDPQPMYRQIESQLRDFILAGVIKPGTKLPTIRGLAVQLTCSVITTKRAYQDLEDEGLILTRQGRGTVVAQITEEKMRPGVVKPWRQPSRSCEDWATRRAHRRGDTRRPGRNIATGPYKQSRGYVMTTRDR